MNDVEPKLLVNTLYQSLLANREADKSLTIGEFLLKYSTWTAMYRSQLSSARLLSMRTAVGKMK